MKRFVEFKKRLEATQRRVSSIFGVQHSPPHRTQGRARDSKLTFFSAKALMNHVGGFFYHISNPKSFDKRFLFQNPSIGVNNVLIFTSLVLSLV